MGYKVHLSEACEPDALHLITNFKATAAMISTGDVTEAIHLSFASRNLLPNNHIVDTGYLNTELLLNSQGQHQVELLRSTRSDLILSVKVGNSSAVSHFEVDGQHQGATCPEEYIRPQQVQSYVTCCKEAERHVNRHADFG